MVGLSIYKNEFCLAIMDARLYRLTHQPSISLIKEFKVSLTTIFSEYHFSTMCGRGWKKSHYMIYSPFVSTGIEYIEIYGQTRL